MKRLRSVIIYFLSVVSLSANGQGPVIKNYTTSDGLASNSVYFTTQDSHGFIWFATDNGVSRFDGTRFRNYSVTDGLPDNIILKIMEDAEGRLWFLAFNGKLSYYQNDKIYNASNSQLIREINFNDFITCFFQDSKKNIWIASFDFTLVKISPGSKVTKIKTGFNCKCIWEDNSGQIRFLSPDRIFLLKDTAFTSIPLSFPLLAGVFLTDKNLLLALGVNGLDTLTIEGKLLPVKNSKGYTNINSFSVSSNGKKDIWLANNEGVTEFDNEIISPGTEHHYFQNYNITSVLKDKDNNLWFSSIRSGVFMIPSRNIKLYDVTNGLAGNTITAVALISENVLLTDQYNGSLQLIDHGVVKNVAFPASLQPREILDIKDDKKGNAWILTKNTVYKYHEGKFSEIKQHPDRWYKTIFISNDDIPWIGCGRDLKQIKGDSVITIYSDTLAKMNINHEVNRIYAIQQIKRGQLILGTDEGLYYFINGKMTAAAHKNSLLTHRINALTVTADSTLWIATDGYGLLSLKHDSVVQYTTEDRLLSNKYNCLLADSNNLYVATDNGLNFLKEEKKRLNIFSYTITNGLASNHINQVIKGNGSTVILATDHGVVELNSKDIPLAYNSIPYILSITVNDGKQSLKDSYSLKYNANTINVEFGAINFNSSNNIDYRYKLTGADTGWNYTTYTAIKYSFLHPGNYSFVVQAQNADGKWNTETASVSFYIETPWWQTWWFRLLTVLSITVIIVLIVEWQTRIYKQKINRERAQAESELKALRAQINPHFVYNSLSAIQELVLKNQKENANIYFSKFATLLRSILTHSRESEITLKEEIDSMQLYLELEMLRYNWGFDFKFEIEKWINPESVYIPSMILQPYIENAVLHGLAPLKKDGRLTVSFKLSGHHMVCTIEDNGVGRKKAGEMKQKDFSQIRPSLGMLITKERIDLINMHQKQKINLNITDLSNEVNGHSGTRVSIYFPLDKTGLN